MPERINVVKKFLKKKIVIIPLILVILLLLAFVLYIRAVKLDPPAVSGSIPISNITNIAADVKSFEHGWIRKNTSGLYEMYLEGSPFEMGYYNGVLTKDLIRYQEQVFVDRLKEMVPSESYLNFLKYLLAWFNRDMDVFVPLEYQQEINGVSMAASEEYNFIAHNYQRILNYHAAHDIGHTMQNMNLVGCTAFATWGENSEDSSLIVGRNFDFYMGEDFARNKIVAFLKPGKGYKLMMITWGGMIGVVSGMNEKGLTVTLNSAKSPLPSKAKMPVSILARLILQYAGNIAEAIAIAQNNETFVSESFLIASAEDNRAIVIEKSPESTDVYNPDGSTLILTNHFQGDLFRDEKLNAESKSEGASLYRYQRLEELLKRTPDMNPVKAAEILRDRKGLNDIEIGNGNEKAINQLIAHHSVIFKPENLQVWVSTDPYQEGKYICYDLNKIFNGNVDITNEITESQFSIAADTFLLSKEWTNYNLYIQKTGVIKKELDRLEDESDDKAASTISPADIKDYLQLNPDYYYPYYIAGRYYYETGESEKALSVLETALSKEIPRKVDRDEIINLQSEIKTK